VEVLSALEIVHRQSDSSMEIEERKIVTADTTNVSLVASAIPRSLVGSQANALCD
jgi:hypothetical protein